MLESYPSQNRTKSHVWCSPRLRSGLHLATHRASTLWDGNHPRAESFGLHQEVRGRSNRTLSDHHYDSPAVNGPINWRVILVGAEHCSGKKYRWVNLTGIPPGIQSQSPDKLIRISFNVRSFAIPRLWPESGSFSAKHSHSREWSRQQSQ